LVFLLSDLALLELLKYWSFSSENLKGLLERLTLEVKMEG
jgi:hypothetical protein